MLKIIMIIALIVVAISMLAMFVRIIKGPTLADRILALDAIGLQLMAYIHRFRIFTRSYFINWYFSLFRNSRLLKIYG